MNLWFTEELPIVPGTRLSVKVQDTLYSHHSQYQHIAVYDTFGCGKMLTLDDVIQTTEYDEFAYHEMIAHIPLFSHPSPRKVLVIGGGDGGTVREAIKHPTVEKIDMCEIDEEVVNACIKHMPSLSEKLNDKKVNLHFMDGAEWARNHKGEYDVIMVDSSDPVGPAEILFKQPFYEDCKNALTDDGILVTQAENFFLHPAIIKELFTFGKKMFTVHDYYFTIVPTYPGGMIGFTFFSKKYSPADNIENKLKQNEYSFINSLKYWNIDIHKSSFILPHFARTNINNA